jgi:cysteine desulfurase family protein (TIGR01976 family)
MLQRLPVQSFVRHAYGGSRLCKALAADPSSLAGSISAPDHAIPVASVASQPNPKEDARSRAPWEVCVQDPKYEEKAAASILRHGFVVLPGLLPARSLEKLNGSFCGRTDKILQQLSDKGINIDVGSSVGFHEVVLRSPGRYDVPCDFDAVPTEVRANFEGICARVLEPDATNPGAPSRAFAGVVRAQPGSSAQLWHADSPHHSAEHAPPNLLNVLVAMRDIGIEDGPTDIVPNSHKLTNHHMEGAKFGTEVLYQAPQNSPARIGSTEKGIPLPMAAGSALIFDDRILHRGGHNQSSKDRDVAFFSYRRASFMPETHYEATRSLSGYDHRNMPRGIRSEFPGLDPPGHSVQPVLGDGASGSQLHESVIDAMVEQLRFGTANIGGHYSSSVKAQQAVANARDAMADFLGCTQPEVAFGPSMTALTFHLAEALRNNSSLTAGDNVVLDPMSHGANVWTWVRLAEACGAEVRWIPFAAESSNAQIAECKLDTRLESLASVIDDRTRFVASGYASNGVGTVHDVQAICFAARELSNGKALSFIDAVHYAPHGVLDVAKIGCDFLACSPYKFFGPHSGVLFGRSDLMQRLPVARLDCSDDTLPSEANCDMSRWEVGTQNYEALAGVAAAVNYLASLGSRFGGVDADGTRRQHIEAGMQVIAAHERDLKRQFLKGAENIRGLHLLGVTDVANGLKARTATFAVAKTGLTGAELAESLCERGVWCTSGNHYAGFWNSQSDGRFSNDTGMTRIGLLHYNTLDEVDRILSALEDV